MINVYFTFCHRIKNTSLIMYINVLLDPLGCTFGSYCKGNTGTADRFGVSVTNRVHKVFFCSYFQNVPIIFSLHHVSGDNCWVRRRREALPACNWTTIAGPWWRHQSTYLTTGKVTFLIKKKENLKRAQWTRYKTDQTGLGMRRKRKSIRKSKFRKETV